LASGKEKNGIEEIYEKYYKDVYRFVLALSKNPHIAEDITQETFVKAIKAVDRFKGDCDIKVWLCQIAKNTYFTYAGKQNREQVDVDAVNNRLHLWGMRSMISYLSRLRIAVYSNFISGSRD
jgi:RNA polymerase sigma-70 factor (ECF subfamily)